jgi:aromatic-L-amino-acid decarboxylase
VDPIAAVADIAQEHGLWHHVDAAWAGSAMLCEEHRGQQAGAERADSYTFNPHKWLFTNFDCNVLWVADRKPLIDTLSIVPPYLRDAATDTGEVIDYRDWHISLGRRFRALKLWWVLRSYGAQGLRTLLREHVALAQELGRRIDEHPELERVAPVSFALVCFAHAGGNEATDAMARAINAEPTLAVTPSSVGETRFVRVAIGQTRTTAADAERLWRAIEAAA